MTQLRKIFLLPLKNCLDLKKFDTLLQFVSKEKADRIKKHYNNTDKKLSLYAQLAVKLIVNKEYGIDINRITIITDDFGKQIESIRIYSDHRLVFQFYDGRVEERFWQNPSRRESWTPEMKQQAAMYAGKRYNHE